MKSHYLGLIALLAPVSVVALSACVGDAPTPTNPVDAGVDSTNVESGVDSGGGNDASADAPVEAAPPPCGAAGETCCVAPLAPCGDALLCSSGKKCMVSDAWALGEYKTFHPSDGFVTQLVTAHYDGSAWTLVKPVLTEFTLAPPSAEDMYQNGNSVRVLTNKSSIGRMFSWNGLNWQECKLGNACVGPTATTSFWALTSVKNSGNTDYLLAGTNLMYRCAAGAPNCPTVQGIPGNFSQGNFAGTTNDDVWYAAFDRVLHFDGSVWTGTAVADAVGITEITKSDVWVGYTKLRHWDGTAWSSAYLIDGVATPGNIYALAGNAPNDVLAVGNDGTGGFSAHWDGTAWKNVALPANMTMPRRIYAPSAIDAFTVGRTGAGTNKGMIAHWDGSKWSEMPSPAVTYAGEQQQGTLTWTAVTGAARHR